MTESSTSSPTRPPEVTIRDLRWWDIESVHEIEVDLFHNDPWSVGQFWNELAGVPQTRDFVVAERRVSGSPEDISKSGELLGYACLSSIGDTSDVQTIAVARHVQGQGIGRLLLSLLIEKASERGVDQVMLDARAENSSAIALYESVGFHTIHRRKAYYAPGVDAVVMQLDIKAES
jgi:ribosomal-protein-alanine N-acetyltransferase